MSSSSPYSSIGGHAVIEGVQMRSPRFSVVAIRRSNRKITIRHQRHDSLSNRIIFFEKPFFRGIAFFLESLYHGVEALGFSAHVSSEADGKDSHLSVGAVLVLIFIVLALGMGLFVAIPHALTAWLIRSVGEIHPDSARLHLLDGAFRIIILIAYVRAVAMLPNIRRMLQYQGAEHQTVQALVGGQELTIESARRHSVYRTWCVSTYFLVLLLASIVLFNIVFPILDFKPIVDNVVASEGLWMLIKMALMLPLAGLIYEFLRFNARHSSHFFCRMVIWPVLLIQMLITRQPTDDQLEVALASLRQMVRLENGIPEGHGALQAEFEISHLSDLGRIPTPASGLPA